MGLLVNILKTLLPSVLASCPPLLNVVELISLTFIIMNRANYMGCGLSHGKYSYIIYIFNIFYIIRTSKSTQQHPLPFVYFDVSS